MIIKSIRYLGIKGASKPVEIFLDPATTVLCGKNDAGKSTALEAMNLFFNGKQIPEPLVTKINGIAIESSWVEIVFDDVPSDIVIDSTAKTTLADELLLTPEGMLRIKRDFTGSKPKTTIIAPHPVLAENQTSLLELKIKDLKNLVSEWGIGDRVADHRSSGAYRRALYTEMDRFILLDEYELSNPDSDLKDFVARLNDVLPSFSLFKAEQVSNEGESFIQSPATAVVERVLKSHSESLGKVTKMIIRDMEIQFRAVADELGRIAPSLATTFHPDDLKPDWKKAFSKASFVDHMGVPLSMRGSGMRRLALLSFFRAQIGSNMSSNHIYAVEEPEVFLHPKLQTEIWSTLFDLSSGGGQQIILTTHSPNFVRLAPVDSIRYITDDSVHWYSPGGMGTVASASDLLPLIQSSLGVLSDHNVKCFLLVEGSRDIESLTRLFSTEITEKEFGLGSAVDDGRLMMLPIGGCGATSIWSGRLDSLDRTVIQLLDGDKPPYEHKSEYSLEEDGFCVTAKLDVRELENTLPRNRVIEILTETWGYAGSGLDPQALEAQLEDFLPQDETHYSICDIPTSCAEAFYMASGSPIDSRSGTVSDDDRIRIRDKEAKVKYILARAFGQCDANDLNYIKATNLGSLLKLLQGLVA